jgi:hypothetical protein
MAFRFRRRLGLVPGLHLNLGKRGASLSVGVRGLHTTFGRRPQTTVGWPGSGVSYTMRHHARRARKHGLGLLGLIAFGVIVWAILH